MRPFLTARWLDLLLVTWKVPDELLEPYLPHGLELDRHEGSALVSLVAFDFRDTRVYGLPWPGFIDFPELNLRFYVRHQGRRGVVFIREYVPSAIVAQLANLIYNEPYRSAKYTRAVDEHVLITGGRVHRISARRSGDLYTPGSESIEHFIKEHELGFGTRRDGTPLCYRVHHPVWRVWPQVDAQLDIDTAVLYGPQWGFLAKTPPFSVVAAEGSEIAVYPAEPLATSASATARTG
ncbi:MAG: DUF2071 domain-containing protein [Myxococcaceae bacterium]